VSVEHNKLSQRRIKTVGGTAIGGVVRVLRKASRSVRSLTFISRHNWPIRSGWSVRCTT